MRKVILALIVVAAIAAIVWPFGYRRLAGHKLELRTYFDDVQGLREGAPVRVAGVNVGVVKSIRVAPELRGGPVEVVMAVNTPYELKIPSDSVATLTTAGVLGETLVNIDVSRASAQPVQNGGVLVAGHEPGLNDMLNNMERRLEDSLDNMERRLKNTPRDEAKSGTTPDGERSKGRKH